jgi:hypothetical protein
MEMPVALNNYKHKGTTKSFMVTKEMSDAIAAICDEKEMSFSQFLRTALKESLLRYQSVR